MGRSQPQRVSVLAVDDDAEVLEVTRATLAAEGYRVYTAPSGRAALAMLQAYPYISLLITDVVMPGSIDGFDLGKRARLLRPGLHVIYTSGYLRNDGGLDGALLVKPWTTDELKRAIAGAGASARPASSSEQQQT